MTNIAVYLFPRIVQVTPQRYFRFSKVEVGIDFVMIFLWIASASSLLRYGRCIRDQLGDPIRGPLVVQSASTKLCPEWILSIAMGFACVLCYISTFVTGARDLSLGEDEDPIMFARGNWKK
jgi:hypothetical protein